MGNNLLYTNYNNQQSLLTKSFGQTQAQNSFSQHRNFWSRGSRVKLQKRSQINAFQLKYKFLYTQNQFPSLQIFDAEQIMLHNYVQETQTFIKMDHKLSYGKYRILRSNITNQKVQQYKLIFLNQHDFKQYLISYFWRKQFHDLHDPLVKTKKFKLESKSKNKFKTGIQGFFNRTCSQSQQLFGKVYIQDIPLRLSHIKDIPYPQNLYILKQTLKGFQIIFDNIGYIKPFEDLICINRQGNVKVWLNSDLSKNYPNIQNLQQNITTVKSQSKLINEIINMINSNTDSQNQPIKFMNYLKQKHKNLQFLTFQKVFQMISKYSIDFDVQIPLYFQSIVQVLNQQDEEYDTYKTDREQALQYSKMIQSKIKTFRRQSKRQEKQSSNFSRKILHENKNRSFLSDQQKHSLKSSSSNNIKTLQLLTSSFPLNNIKQKSCALIQNNSIRNQKPTSLNNNSLINVHVSQSKIEQVDRQIKKQNQQIRIPIQRLKLQSNIQQQQKINKIQTCKQKIQIISSQNKSLNSFHQSLRLKLNEKNSSNYLFSSQKINNQKNKQKLNKKSKINSDQQMNKSIKTQKLNTFLQVQNLLNQQSSKSYNFIKSISYQKNTQKISIQQVMRNINQRDLSLIDKYIQQQIIQEEYQNQKLKVSNQNLNKGLHAQTYNIQLEHEYTQSDQQDQLKSQLQCHQQEQKTKQNAYAHKKSRHRRNTSLQFKKTSKNSNQVLADNANILQEDILVIQNKQQLTKSKQSKKSIQNISKSTPMENSKIKQNQKCDILNNSKITTKNNLLINMQKNQMQRTFDNQQKSISKKKLLVKNKININSQKIFQNENENQKKQSENENQRILKILNRKKQTLHSMLSETLFSKFTGQQNSQCFINGNDEISVLLQNQTQIIRKLFKKKQNQINNRSSFNPLNPLNQKLHNKNHSLQFSNIKQPQKISYIVNFFYKNSPQNTQKTISENKSQSQKIQSQNCKSNNNLEIYEQQQEQIQQKQNINCYLNVFYSIPEQNHSALGHSKNPSQNICNNQVHEQFDKYQMNQCKNQNIIRQNIISLHQNSQNSLNFINSKLSGQCTARLKQKNNLFRRQNQSGKKNHSKGNMKGFQNRKVRLSIQQHRLSINLKDSNGFQLDRQRKKSQNIYPNINMFKNNVMFGAIQVASYSNNQNSEIKAPQNLQQQKVIRPITGRSVFITNQNGSSADFKSEEQSLVDYTYKSYDKWKDASKIAHIGVNNEKSNQNEQQIFHQTPRILTADMSPLRHADHRQLI